MQTYEYFCILATMKRKTCKSPNCINPVWARGNCLNCDKKQFPHKYEIKRSNKGITLSSSKSEKVSKKPACTTKKQGVKPKTVKPIANISKKQKSRLVKYRIRRDKFLKENPVCMFPDCTSTRVECHHAAGRNGHLLYDTKYFRSLCRMHHEYIERNSTLAKELGLSVDRLNK